MSKIDIKLDLKGKVCPMPAALTRKEIKKMKSMEIIEISGDFELALENVIKMAKKSGAIIIESEKSKDFFKVIAKKK